MFYYEVVPADRNYHSDNFLTYQYSEKLKIGQIVVVTLQTKTIIGFVINRVKKPLFQTKTISRIIDLVISSDQLKLFRWTREYYPYNLATTASLFVPPGLNTKKLPLLNSYNSAKILKVAAPRLTDDQQSTLDGIIGSKARTNIVHGDTGTGKTRLYIELAKEVVSKGRSALILTPEISLTPQLITRFKEVFDRVHVAHSRLSSAERRDIWRGLSRTEQPQVVVGPRSALFLPLSSLGLIVIDEFHDAAYKQEQSPRYHALRVAAKLAEIHSAKLVLGSATPPVEDYFYALGKGAQVYRLTQLAVKSGTQRTTKIVNLSLAQEASGKPLLSNKLLAEIQMALNNNTQVLVFHNKRGSSRSVLCQSCGWFAHCNRCNIPYTYHADKHSFLCHTCGNQETTPNNCPDCGSTDIIFRSPGTKSIAESLAKIFPGAIIGRYDKDNTREFTFAAQQPLIEKGEVDILVGTQLLTKGHDLPKLSLVAVILAEAGLQFPDFISEERSYQLLHQIAGRTGRGHLPGTVVLQTYNPEQKTLSAAEHKKNDWDRFYQLQLNERQLFGFPPFRFLLKVEVSKKNEKNAQKTADKLAAQLRDKFPKLEILGPTPAFIPKKADLWQWQIIIKSNKRSTLLTAITSLPKNCSYDIDPITLL